MPSRRRLSPSAIGGAGPALQVARGREAKRRGTMARRGMPERGRQAAPTEKRPRREPAERGVLPREAACAVMPPPQA
ncbi:hypothetical protein PUR_03950 [Paenibacillus sp. URB8-2]|nr:hypothetical protein PUR_03950 [Paenibacillus sp. URB8-2]